MTRVGPTLVLVAVIVVAIFLPYLVGPDKVRVAVGYGVLVLALIWALLCVLNGAFTFKGIFTGDDHRPSTSQFQFFLWTIIVIFAYVSLFTAQLLTSNGLIDLSNIPQNVLIALGLSITTVVGAKAITVSKIDSNDTAKVDAQQVDDPQATSLKHLVTDDAGDLDLSKAQILGWTTVAAVVYVTHVLQVITMAVAGQKVAFPDIDTALMVMMGLGHGTYLGNKLVSSSKPQLSGITPGSGDEAASITVSGASLGASQAGSRITIDGLVADVTLLGQGWTDTGITFTLPGRHPDGTPWIQVKHPALAIGVIVGGLDSNTVSFTYQPDSSGKLTIPDQQLAGPLVGRPYLARLLVRGGSPPMSWATQDLLPGLALTPDGVLSGQPTDVADAWVTVTVTDSANAKDARTFHVEILNP